MNGQPIEDAPKHYGEDSWEESPLVEEIRTAKEWGLTPSQWFTNEPEWSKEIMMAYERLTQETEAAIAYLEEKRSKRKR